MEPSVEDKEIEQTETDEANLPDVEEVAAEEPVREAEPDAYDEPTPEAEAVPEQIEGILEALIFTSARPVTTVKLSMAAGVRTDTVESVIVRLRERYVADGRGFTLENLGGGWQMLSNPHYVDWVERLHLKEADGKLSPAALETLAVVAYRQPVMRADIEAIRGVQVGAILKSLMEKDLVRIAGRADALGRPMLYGTTKRFLDHFGLGGLSDLPNVRELQEP